MNNTLSGSFRLRKQKLHRAVMMQLTLHNSITSIQKENCGNTITSWCVLSSEIDYFQMFENIFQRGNDYDDHDYYPPKKYCDDLKYLWWGDYDVIIVTGLMFPFPLLDAAAASCCSLCWMLRVCCWCWMDADGVVCVLMWLKMSLCCFSGLKADVESTTNHVGSVGFSFNLPICW